MERIIGLIVITTMLWLDSQGRELKENDPCTNPHGRAGRCIYFRECDPIMRIYNKTMVMQDELKFVSQSKCGITADNGSLFCCADSVDNPRLPTEKITLPKPPDCGVDFSYKIFGGQITGLDDFPWAGLIEYRKPDGQTGFHCGASLINSRYVVTAAHCVKGIPNGWQVIGVRLGEWDLNNENDCLDGDCTEPPVNVAIDKIIVHDGYDPKETSHYNDIALIRFTKDVNKTSFIAPVCLPTDDGQSSRNIVGSKGWAVGWGKTETGSSSNFKMKVELEFNDLQSCSNIYRPSRVILRDTQMCAGGVRSKDTCAGDSGGGLSKRIHANHFLYGIVSFGPNKCGTHGVPGVYTNVEKYIEWIESKL